MSADDRQPDEGRSGRSPAEWVTFAASCIVLVVLVGLVASGMRGESAPAQPTARVDGPVEQRADGFHVPVLVRNVGDDAAADVQVVGELTMSGEATEGDVVIAFLAGQEDAEVVLVFPDDPADGELVVRVSSFSLP